MKICSQPSILIQQNRTSYRLLMLNRSWFYVETGFTVYCCCFFSSIVQRKYNTTTTGLLFALRIYIICENVNLPRPAAVWCFYCSVNRSVNCALQYLIHILPSICLSWSCFEGDYRTENTNHCSTCFLATLDFCEYFSQTIFILLSMYQLILQML